MVGKRWYDLPLDTRSIGRSAEDMATAYIESLGWRILQRNAHLRFGEIDILAESPEAVIVVEVKAKKSASQGYAVEMLTSAKQRTLTLLAKMVQRQYNKPVRIDVIAIDNYPLNPQLMHYPNCVGES